MSRSYTPGVWAQQYDKLPAARKDAIHREVDRIFAERTGFRGKLDPERDKAFIRLWLRIRDAVMSGATKGGARVFLWVDGLKGRSTDPRHRDWFDIVRAEPSPAGMLGQGTPSIASGAGGVRRVLFGSVSVWFDGKDPASVLLSPGSSWERASVQFSSPGMVMTWNLARVMVSSVRVLGPRIQVELRHGGLRFDYD